MQSCFSLVNNICKNLDGFIPQAKAFYNLDSTLSDQEAMATTFKLGGCFFLGGAATLTVSAIMIAPTSVAGILLATSSIATLTLLGHDYIQIGETIRTKGVSKNPKEDFKDTFLIEPLEKFLSNYFEDQPSTSRS